VCTYKKIDTNTTKKGFNVALLIVIILLITIITIISLYCYKRMLTRTLDNTIEDAIKEQAFKKFGEYKALGEISIKPSSEVKK